MKYELEGGGERGLGWEGGGGSFYLFRGLWPVTKQGAWGEKLWTEGRARLAGTDGEGFVGSMVMMVKTPTDVTVTRPVHLVVSIAADSSAEEMIPLRVFGVSVM